VKGTVAHRAHLEFSRAAEPGLQIGVEAARLPAGGGRGSIVFEMNDAEIPASCSASVAGPCSW